jgi:hypothetical protein
MEIVSSHSSIQLQFCSVDGDHGCQTCFDADFQKLLPGISLIQDLSPIVASISDWCHLVIGDFLHIHKNARTRLFKRNVHYNGQSSGSGTNITDLARVLGPSKYLSDLSSIGRMRDVYPLALFTIENALHVSQNGNVDSFIDLVIYSLWQAAVVNKFLSGAMRQILLGVVFYLIWENHHLITSLRRNGTLTVEEKRTTSTYEVTLAALGKMRRMLATILAQIHVIRFHTDGFGLDRIGSHVEENYVGTIRQRCHHDHRHETIFRAVSRMEFVKSHIPDLGVGCRLSSRASFGGVRITGDGYSHIPFESPAQLAN